MRRYNDHPFYRWCVKGQVGQIIPRYILASTKSNPMCHVQKNKVPLYLPPTIFSRIDNPSEYNYRDGPHNSTPDKRYDRKP